MVIELDRKSDFENANKMIQYFPNISNGYKNNLSLRDLAIKIKKHSQNSYFSNYSTETIRKFLRYALVGVEFNPSLTVN